MSEAQTPARLPAHVVFAVLDSWRVSRFEHERERKTVESARDELATTTDRLNSVEATLAELTGWLEANAPEELELAKELGVTKALMERLTRREQGDRT